MNQLKLIQNLVRREVSDWERRTGKKKVPPYPADAPCYYCTLRDSPELEPCKYCIQNPDAVIYEPA